MQPGRQCDGRSRRNRLQPGPGRRSGRPAQATPPFGLTLRADELGKRHQPAPCSGPLNLLLLSVLALLALACFPVLRSGRLERRCSTTDALPGDWRRKHAQSTSANPGRSPRAPITAARTAPSKPGRRRSSTEAKSPDRESESSSKAGRRGRRAATDGGTGRVTQTAAPTARGKSGRAARGQPSRQRRTAASERRRLLAAGPDPDRDRWCSPAISVAVRDDPPAAPAATRPTRLAVSPKAS